MTGTPVQLSDRSGRVVFEGTQVGGGGSQPAGLLPVTVAELQADLSLTGPANVDGVDVADGDRVLAVVQVDQTQQGIWTVNTSGAWTRPDDFAAGASIAGGTIVAVSNAGSSWVNSLWTIYNQDAQTAPIVVDASPIGLVIVAADTAIAYVPNAATPADIIPTLTKPLDCAFNPVLNLPTNDPGIAGALWNNAGTPAISTGP